MAVITIKNISPSKFKLGLLLSSVFFSIIFVLDKINLITLNISSLNDNFIKQIYGHSYLADIIVITIPFIISDLTQTQTKKSKKIINLILFIFFFFVLILTNSRSGIFALAIGILFLIPQNNIQKIAKWFLILIPIIFLSISCLPQYQNKFEKTLSGEREKYWTIAFNGFLKSPIFGNGPNTFAIIRKANQSQPINSNLSHSSLFNFLCENGIIFTLIIYLIIFYGIKKIKAKNNLFFVASIIVLVHSLLDPTWNSPGIFIISLYLIFYHYPLFSIADKKNQTQTNIFIFLATICFIFSVSDSISNNLFFDKNYQLSLVFNPFNLDSRLGLISTLEPASSNWQKNLKFTLKYFNKNEIVFETLIDKIPFPQNEPYYYQLFDLNPKESFNYYSKLIQETKKNNNFVALEKILYYIDNHFQENEMNPTNAIPISKESYNYALKLYSTDKEKATFFFKLAVKLFPVSGFYQVDLANALWNSNQQEAATNQLSINCQQYSQAKEQCQMYLNGHQYTNFNQPGDQEYTKYINEKM